MVTDPPKILSNPVTQQAIAGRPTTFSVQASGSGPFNYKWTKDGKDIGIDGSRLMLSYVKPDDAGSYRVQVSNQFGQVVSSPAVLSVLDPLSITAQPVSMTVQEGQAVILTVSASSVGPIAYQWRKGGIDIPGANNSTLLFQQTQVSDSGEYSVSLENSSGSILSQPAYLVVNSSLETFGSWISSHGFSGENASTVAAPMRDGVSNILKYAFNLDPKRQLTENEKHMAPNTGISGLPHISFSRQADSITSHVEFVRRKRGDLNYQLQVSENLVDWQTVTQNPTLTDIDSTWERVVIEDVVLAQTIKKRYFRFLITLNQTP